MNLLVENYPESKIKTKTPNWNIWHKLLIRFDKDVSIKFLNNGYHHLNDDEKISLLSNDESDRNCIQLYDHLISKVNVYYKDLLEIGSGRGGGASYINRYYTPKSYTGVDISGNITDFCNMYYNEPGLKFVKSDALKLPFKQERFDIALSIESARFSGNMSKLFNEVYKILKSHGLFLFADMVETNKVETLKHFLRMAGFTIEYKQDITQNVIAALDLDNTKKEQIIQDIIPVFLKKAFRQFAGTIGSERYNLLDKGEFKYMSFILRKIS